MKTIKLNLNKNKKHLNNVMKGKGYLNYYLYLQLVNGPDRTKLNF